MKKIIPTNVTADGCACTIVSRYEGRAAYVKGLTSGMKFYPATGVIEVYEEDSDQYGK